MNAATWDVSDAEPNDQNSRGFPQPTLVTLHYLRGALRRRWLACVGSALLGILLAVAYLSAIPAPHTASTTLVLAHDPAASPTLAMATDASLATTRSVAQRTINALRLPTTPDILLKSVTAEATTSDLLVLKVKAASDVDAVRTLSAYTTVFLKFRADQLSAQSNSLIQGQNVQIHAFQGQVEDLTRRINLLTSSGDASSSRLSDSISERAEVTAAISGLQQSVEATKLKTTALVASSRIIDSPAVETGGQKRRLVLTVASGLVGGVGIGVGLVLFLAITSSRLRRRADVATALGVPVSVSVGRLTPLPRLLQHLPVLKSINQRRADDRRRLAHTIEQAVPGSGIGRWLAVACVDNAHEVCFGVVEAALALQEGGADLRLIDLTEKGNVGVALRRLRPGRPGQLTVIRPQGIPSLVTDIDQIETYPSQAQEIPTIKATEVCLVVADMNPAVGAEHLTAWTQRVVVAITAGASSAERVRTTKGLVHAAGLDLWCAVLLRSEARDESSGNQPGRTSVAGEE